MSGLTLLWRADITRCLQHKRDQVCKAKRHDILLEDLKISENGSPLEPSRDGVDPLAEPSPMLPLWRRVDKQFWWNEWLLKPFIDAGVRSQFRTDLSVGLSLRIVQLDGYILPIMQGYLQIASFNVPPMHGEPDELALVDYIVISRRSRDRAGLRYQRRGIGEEGNVANFVETESVMRVQVSRFPPIYYTCPTKTHVTAGRPYKRFQLCPAQRLEYVARLRFASSTDLSITPVPLYWTQSGPGLKPPPLLSTGRTQAQHAEAFRRHFNKIVLQYGPQVTFFFSSTRDSFRSNCILKSIVNLAEQGGREGVLSQAYDKRATELNSPDVRYLRCLFLC